MPCVSLLRLGGLVAILPAVALGSAWAPAAEPPPAARSLDDQLFGDAGGEADAEVDRQLFGNSGSAPSPAAVEQKKTADQRRIDAWNDLLKEELKAAAIDEMQNPLVGIARSMRLAEGLIGQANSGQMTQQVQAEIVADLDKLLEQAQKKCQACASPSQSTAERKPAEQPKPGEPEEGKPAAKPSTTSDAKPGKAEGQSGNIAEAIAAIKQVWGELPEQERQEMLQLSVEEFLPKYADLIEQYYKRLAADRKAAP